MLKESKLVIFGSKVCPWRGGGKSPWTTNLKYRFVYFEKKTSLKKDGY